MPYEDFVHEPISVQVSDRIPGVISQIAEVTALNMGVDSEKCLSIELGLTITLHDFVTGELLIGYGFEPYPKSLFANNETLVDADTGEILAISGLHPQSVWDAIVASPRIVLRQGDWMEKKRNLGELNIPVLARAHMQAADTVFGYFTPPQA